MANLKPTKINTRNQKQLRGLLRKNYHDKEHVPRHIHIHIHLEVCRRK